MKVLERNILNLLGDKGEIWLKNLPDLVKLLSEYWQLFEVKPVNNMTCSIGTSHSYYFGRTESDITPWIEYFIEGMTFSFEKVVQQMSLSENLGKKDHLDLMRTLFFRNKKSLRCFRISG